MLARVVVGHGSGRGAEPRADEAARTRDEDHHRQCVPKSLPGTCATFSIMSSWNESARAAVGSGAAASLLSAAALALCGWLENRAAAGPLNGPSQWLFGRRAAYRRDPTVRHTLTGYASHHATATGCA